MNIYEILGIIIIHWFADFVCQTDDMAKGKSKSNKWLLLHTFTYSIAWLAVGVALTHSAETLVLVMWFSVTTFIAHTITDYFTSRLNAKLWAKGDTHNFFVSVGFDQVLHYAQLFITYLILFK